MVYGDIISGPEWLPLKIKEGVAYKQRLESFRKEIIEFKENIIISDKKLALNNFVYLEFYNDFVYVNNIIWNDFFEKFRYYIKDNKLNYDNLINILIMVKDAGDDFENVLKENLEYIDKWTILDTGSNDNTIEIIKKTLKNKKGNLYQESFINFRDSRNRLIELAGTECVFNIILDDSYIIKGKLREFLEYVRGDDIADSYSLVIDNNDISYYSNRIIKSDRNLKYINLIHEVIENNVNIEIPKKCGYIYDKPSEYMYERTLKRKQQDIEILLNMNKNDPLDTRTYYYIADSYLSIRNWEKAIEWFRKRVEIGGGYEEEINESLYYIAAISENYLNVPWEKCHQMYLECFNYNKTKGDSLYLIGSYYYRNNNMEIAYMYMKYAFELGLPKISLSIRKHIYNYYLPKELMEISLKLGDYLLAENCCKRIIKENYKPEEKEKFNNILNNIINVGSNKTNT